MVAAAWRWRRSSGCSGGGGAPVVAALADLRLAAHGSWARRLASGVGTEAAVTRGGGFRQRDGVVFVKSRHQT